MLNPDDEKTRLIADNTEQLGGSVQALASDSAEIDGLQFDQNFSVQPSTNSLPLETELSESPTTLDSFSIDKPDTIADESTILQSSASDQSTRLIDQPSINNDQVTKLKNIPHNQVNSPYQPQITEIIDKEIVKEPKQVDERPREGGQLYPGDFLSKYRIVESLDAGGMGSVYKVVDTVLENQNAKNYFRAIKVLSRNLPAYEIMVLALTREFFITNHLTHDNIIKVFDIHENSVNDNGRDFYNYFTMEFLTGQSLKELIKESKVSGGMKLERAWPILKEIGEAIAYMHSKGYVHRDIKPANIFITNSGELKLLDFGIAQAAGLNIQDGGESTNLVGKGVSLPYAAKEQIQGYSSTDVRDDIYSFAYVVYELLSGQHPYKGFHAGDVDAYRKSNKKNTQILEKQQTRSTAKFAEPFATPVTVDKQLNGDEPLPIQGLTVKQWKALKTALAINREDRPANMDEWLTSFVPSTKSVSWYSNKLMYGIGGITIVTIIVAGWYFSAQTQTSNSVVAAPPAPVIAEKLNIVAKPCCSQEAKVGVAITLNGEASQKGNSALIHYDWRFSKIPEGSNSVLLDDHSAYPRFIPDQSGVYIVNLHVYDDNKNTDSNTIDITVLPPPLELRIESKFKVGSKFSLNFQALKSGYVRVVYWSKNQDFEEIIPNQSQSGFVEANSDYRYPSDPKKPQYVWPPLGRDKIIVFFSESALPELNQLMNRNGILPEIEKDHNIYTEVKSFDIIK